jgi:hypothetical protein
VSNPGHDAVDHGSGGRFTSGGGGGPSRRDEDRALAQAMEEREGDRADSAYRRVEALKRKQSRSRVARATKAAQSDPKAAKQWEADVASARAKMGGISASQRNRLGSLERAAANGPEDYRRQKAAELAAYRARLGL